MRKILFTLSLASLALLSSCASSSMSTFTSRDGWSIDYPSGWNAGKELATGISFLDTSTKTITVASRVAFPEGNTQTNQDILKDYTHIKTLDTSGNIAFKNISGIFVNYTNTIGSMKIVHKEAWAVSGKYLYTFACTVNDPNPTPLLTTCENMIHSFSIP